MGCAYLDCCITVYAPHAQPICLMYCPQIIIETARFVRKGGGQVEVLLRVRQSSNPTFTFLLPGDPGYPYYRWIVDANPKVRRALVTINLGKNWAKVPGFLVDPLGYGAVL
eukprot:651500-Pelagomonas_calceolata.AAC.2